MTEKAYQSKSTSGFLHAAETAVYWNQQSHTWNQVAPPLRPSPLDIELLEKFVSRKRSDNGASATFRALMLGVTPEIATMHWPAGIELIAVDHSQSMIDDIWPLRGSTTASTLCAKWQKMPVPSESFDVAVTDAAYSQLTFPSDYEATTQELHRVLKPGGQFVFRTFIKPENCESIGDVFDAVRSRKIGSFHIFKWRLLMAAQEDLAVGVRLGDVWTLVQETFPDRAAFAAEQGWPLEALATIDRYRGSDMHYTFPTLNELRHVLSVGFVETASIFPPYEMGDRCPTFVFTTR